MTQTRPTSPSSTPAPRPRRRAFALPLVMLVALAGGLAVILLLDRHGVGALTVQREVQVYTDHHRNVGIKEVTSQWLKTSRGRLAESLDADGLAFVLTVPGGEIAVYMEDGQGTVLTATETLSGDQRWMVEDMLAYLESLPLEFQRDTMRPAGPAEISLAAAPRQVLEALAYAVAGQDRVEPLVSALIREREDTTTDGQMNVGDLGQKIRQAGLEADLTEDQIEELQTMLTVTPKLWRVVAVTTDSRGHRVDRSGGLMETDESHRQQSDTFNQLAPFLTWEQLPLEPEPIDR